MPTGNLGKRTVEEFGIVLKTVPFGESDAIVTILTEQQGKLGALAKGVKRSQKRFMGGLNIFDTGVFRLEEQLNSSKLPIILSLSDRLYFENLGLILEAFAIAAMMIETVDTFSLDRDPEGSLYLRELLQALTRLNQLERSPDSKNNALAIGARFLVSLLTTAGFHDFSKIMSSPEIGPWLTNEQSEPPPLPIVRPFFAELVQSIEMVLGKQMLVRSTLERLLGI